MTESEQKNVAQTKKSFTFSSPPEKDLHRRILRLVGYGPADFFQDACRLMADPMELVTSAHLVAHLIRDLNNSIKHMLASLTNAPEPEEKNEKAESNVRFILRALDIPETDEAASYWIRLSKREYSFAGRVHLRGLGPTRGRDRTLEEDWRQILKVYDVVLDRFEKKYSMVHEVLDKLLQKETPNRDDLKTLKERVPNNAAAFEYFFGKLQNPKWLEPLAKADFFKLLPEPSPTGTHYSCPQTRYLKRMAAHAECHQTIFDVVMNAETENIMARCDLVEATLALPRALAAQTVPKFKSYLDSAPNLFVLPYELGKLITHLAQGGHAAEALELASALLIILPSEDGADTWHDPKTRIQSNEYTGILEESMPHLSEVGGMPVFEFLCGLLATAIEKRRGLGEENDHDDLSHYWRHSLDSYEMHMSREITNNLVTATLDSCRKLVEKDTSTIGHIIEVLDSKHWSIFHRIGLQLLTESAAPPQELVARKLLDIHLWGSRTTRREYNMLAEAHSTLLTHEQQTEIIRRIEAGPDMRGYEDKLDSREASERVRYWRRDRLVPFRDILPTQWQRVCDNLVDEIGEPVDEPMVSSARCVGDISPLDSDEITGKSVEEIVVYLKGWKPTGEWDTPDPEGLGNTLRNVVAEEPVRFAEQAESFVGVDPTYVRSVISGLAEAVKNNRQFPWGGVLRLCAWVLQQPNQIPGRVSRRIHDIDPDWGWTRRRIVDLITKGITEGSASIPFPLRADVWSLLQTLMGDPDPTPEHEAEYGGKNMNTYELAVNTTRGETMEAIIFYMSWILRELKIKAGSEERIKNGLQHAPEVATILETHLDPQHDPSLSVRAVFGRWLNYLDYADHQWTKKMLPRILPQDSTLRALRESAWNTYLLYGGGPYNKTAEILIPEYRFSAEEIANMTPIAHGDPQKALAFHVAILYLRGILNPEGEDGTIQAFLQKADDNLRGELVRVMGDIIRHNKKPSDQWLDRAMKFWVERLEVVRASENSKQHTEEMDAFGYWFVSRKFDDDWALKNLEDALKFGLDIEFDYLVVENLVSLASVRPLECARCLQLIVTSDGKGKWNIRSMLEHTRKVLAVIFAGTNNQAKAIAREIVSALLARGHQEIRDAEPSTTLSN